jgi:hypothetical protein
MTKVKKACESYLGNRGEMRTIKKCSKYNNLWFIVFKDYPEDVEISFSNNSYYECYDQISIKDMQWNESYYKTIEERISK